MPRVTFRLNRRYIHELLGYGLRLLLAVLVALILVVVLGSMLRQGLTSATVEEVMQARTTPLPPAIDWRNRLDPNDPATYPSLHVSVDHAQGSSAPWYPKGESPLLAQMVQRGLLPPVHERVGTEPTVMRGSDGIGTYGGTWMRLANSPGDVGIISWRLSYAALFRWSPMGQPIEPHVAKALEIHDEHRTFIIHLRRGMRWSDGQPFTADDVLYWWNHEITNRTLGSGAPPAWITVQGHWPKMEKRDDYTLIIRYPVPFGSFLQMLASHSQQMANSPAHYLSRYHPELGDPALIERECKAMDIPSARALYGYVKSFDNPEHPRLWPWVPRQWRTNPPYVYVRNPYYFVVDEAGNQLPYIDRIQFDVQTESVMSQSFANGFVSMQTRHVRYQNYTELMDRAAAVNQRILPWYSATRSAWAIYPNAQRFVPGNPQTLDDCPDLRTRELWWKRSMLANADFRKALSLAIDRAAIIRAEYNDQVSPAQVEPGPLSPFHDARLAQVCIDFDPVTANQKLDQLGLTDRDIDGMRTFPDGTRMTFFLDFTGYTGIGPAQFVVDDWARIGVRVIARERARTLFYTQKAARDVDLTIWTSESDHFPLQDGRAFVAGNTEANWGIGWGRWYQLGGLFGDERANINSATPPPPGSPVREGLNHFTRAIAAPTHEAQQREMQRVLDITAEQLWTISIAEHPPALVVVSNRMKNVPKVAMVSATTSTPGNAGIETYFFENNSDAPGIFTDTLNQLTQPASLPRRTGGTADAPAVISRSNLWAGWILRGLIISIIGALVIMLVLRHPFVGRRLVIMVPTLLVISVIVFTIIQLPPGDYLTSRILAIEESGDAQAAAQLDDLRSQFHFEDPVWKQYLRWTGLLWFLPTELPANVAGDGHWFTRMGFFQNRNTGLLQGNLGRSMESSQLVSDMVGDRILLTFLISAGTILLTWLIAIPIGIYSAVRQYSKTDCLFTLIGFVGMSVPGFLLALVLGVWADVQGLFSPEFAAQPYWDWPKLMDLLRHIWVPIVVMGVTGTAGMIRVMRANLLDELRKPYVTTARAKGVRPIKLLIKYPVRVALNPFVSGIGGIFPQLVSGGAIVSMVLSLPTVGPLLLSALFSQDMYLAGSMLMVLSLLGVFGTLVSDLLLLWLDPRIRYE